MLFNKPLIGSTLLLAFGASCFAQDTYSAKDFKALSGNKIGRAKNDNVIEITYSPGVVNDFLVGTLAYNRIVGNGIGEVSIPLSVTQFKDKEMKKADGTTDSLAMFGPKYTGIGSGIKYRNFPNGLEEGMFYGGGLRVYHWIWEYQKLSSTSSTPKSLKRQFQTFAPLTELGFIKKFSPQASFVISGELGVALHTLDVLEIGNEKAGTPFNQKDSLNKLDPLKLVFYTANAGFRFGF